MIIKRQANQWNVWELILIIILGIGVFSVLVNISFVKIESYAGTNFKTGDNYSGWLAFLGNSFSVFSTVLIIKHYQTETTASQIRHEESINVLKQQIESDKIAKKQIFYLEELNKEKEILKNALKELDNSIFDEYIDISFSYSMGIRNEESSNIFYKNVMKASTNITCTANRIMLDIDLLNLRIIDENLVESIEDENLKKLYEAKDNIYSEFETLVNSINKLNIEIKDIFREEGNLDKKIKIIIKKIPEGQQELSNLIGNLIQIITPYYYKMELCILNEEFDLINDITLKKTIQKKR